MKEIKTEKNTLADEIDIMIDAKINQLPFPQKCKINRVYDDGKHLDIELNGEILEYLQFIGGNAVVNNTAVILYCNGDFNDAIVIV